MVTKNTKKLGLPDPPPYLGLSPKFYQCFLSASLNRIKYVVQDATNILGDKLHQKMDSIAFTQVAVVVLIMWWMMLMVVLMMWWTMVMN